MSRPIAFIPVRGGSKSIPLKNIKNFCGKPLVYWTCKSLQDSPYFEKIVIATDSKEIKETVLSFHFSKLVVYDREPKNAQDKSSTESVMLEYLDQIEYGPKTIFALVQATTPYLTEHDLNYAMIKYKSKKYDSMLSVVNKNYFTWNDKGQSVNYDYKKRPRRQDIKNPTYLENGAFYISTVGNILKSKNRLSGKIGLYEMPEYTHFEIDEPSDWVIAENIMKTYILNNSQKQIDIKHLFADCDGTLTDGKCFYSNAVGREGTYFNVKDGLAFSMLKNKKIKTGIISGSKYLAIQKRAQDIDIDYCFLGCNNKLQTLINLGVDFEKLIYIGDDINDIPVLERAGIKVCPSDANPEVKKIPGIIVLNSKGGDGCISEIVSMFF